MSADTISNPQPAGESKSARKKREKAEAAAAAQAASQPQQESNGTKTPDVADTNGDAFESSYVKELQKNIRNVTKKLNAMTKLDTILAENPDKSLDELLAARKINADQKAQASKKPALQAQLAQLEEQIAQYKKVDADYQSRMSAQHSQLTSAHQAEIEKLKGSLKEQLEKELNTALRQKLLTFSQFLRAAAAKRVIEEEADTDESKAFEGALLLVYGGDDKAVDAVMNLIQGSDEQVPSVEGELLPVKYSQVKQAAVGFGAFPGEETAQEEAPAETNDATTVQPEDTIPSSDPTIAHAGLTELGLNQPVEEEKPIVVADDQIAEASIDDGSANKSAETQWDNAAATAGTDQQLDDSFEMVPRPADETEAVHEPAQPQSTSSWADQTSANATATEATTENNNTNGLASTDAEGYQSVERRGGRGGQGRGGRGGRGRGGPRGGHRGNFRGGRGDGRGRGGRGGAPQPQA
ncbi:hypothetical protein KCU81_g6540, partial [Aureobasidium melanogenum]|uniref:YAG7-like dimerisation domain-containing protein n=1 Tax=Aureobasidium melanogenum (strain CBS 110374) TaxID=1043003 RepID=A0A074W533_AURM1